MTYVVVNHTKMSLTVHDDILSVYISGSVYQQMSLTLHDDIISVYIYIYISVSVYQQTSLIRDDAQNDINVVLGTVVDIWYRYIYTNYIVM
jgi:hypothetical protein